MDQTILDDFISTGVQEHELKLHVIILAAPVALTAKKYSPPTVTTPEMFVHDVTQQ